MAMHNRCFFLCGGEEDGKQIDRLQIRAPEVQAGYLSYLLGKNRADLIGPAVARLAAANREADVSLLMSACERLLEAGRIDEAAEVWNRQAAAGRAGFRTPAGEGEQLAANSPTASTTSQAHFQRCTRSSRIATSSKLRNPSSGNCTKSS
jgi:hypothetical protein